MLELLLQQQLLLLLMVASPTSEEAGASRLEEVLSEATAHEAIDHRI